MRNKIKALLDTLGISTYRFQRDVGISQRTAYDLVNNPDQLPSGVVLSRICDFYRIQPSEVLIWLPDDEERSPN